jgi:hypothetical protein
MTSVMVQSPIAVKRLARWRCRGVLYETHMARLAGGATGIMVSALGPGRRHRFGLVPDDLQTIHLTEGWTASEAELTAVAEAFLGAHSDRAAAGPMS